MNKVKLSSKNQIVIPKEARRALGLSAGDEIIVVTYNDRIELVPRPKSYTSATLGLGKDVWKGVDAVSYVKGERKAWEKKA
ncbi:MAG: AbrB/MazE/SpoVT family DNA-binding domain-containing protein [Thermoleophilia bacterium]|jgi:AbrB family looped-hinge helix DNA binding protein